MMSFNRVILVGTLVRDPELRTTAGGDACCEFRLAVDDARKNRAGELIRRSLYIDIVAWGAQAQSSHQYLTQGSHVLIEGRLQSDEWKTRDGAPRSSIRVIAATVQFLDTRPRSQERNEYPDFPAPERPSSDLPFQSNNQQP